MPTGEPTGLVPGGRGDRGASPSDPPTARTVARNWRRDRTPLRDNKITPKDAAHEMPLETIHRLAEKCSRNPRRVQNHSREREDKEDRMKGESSE